MRSLMSATRRAILALPGNRTRGALALSAVLSLAPLPALASTQVHGTPDAVSVEANNATIEEILGGLGKTFDLKYQSTGKLEKQLTGTYRGSLQRVVTRVLEGYNFIVKSRNGTLEITVLAPQPTSADAAAPVQSTAKSNGGPAPSPVASPASPALPLSPAATTTTTAKTATAERAPAEMSDSALPAPVITVAESNMLPVPMIIPGKGEVPEVLPSTVTMPEPGPSLVPPPEPTPSSVTLPAPTMMPMPMMINPPGSQLAPVPPMNGTGPATDVAAPPKQ
jgi:hypothetical protein